MRRTAAVLREIFKGQAEIFQVLFHLTECPLDFLWCVQNLYTAGEWIVVQRKGLLDLHWVVSVGEGDRSASSEATSPHIKPAGPNLSVHRHGFIRVALATVTPSSLSLHKVFWCIISPPQLNYLQPKRSAVLASQHGWLRSVCALTALR